MIIVSLALLTLQLYCLHRAIEAHFRARRAMWGVQVTITQMVANGQHDAVLTFLERR